MTKISKAGLTAFIIGITFNIILLEPAYAYIDMGTGSMIFQMLVAGLVGAGFTIKMYWRTLKGKVRQLLGRPAEGDHDDSHNSKS